MNCPLPAPVRPRVIAPETGDVLPLEEAIRPALTRGRGAIEILGGPGSGKTTALEHLAAVLDPAENVLLLDEPEAAGVAVEAHERLVVYSAGARHGHLTDTSFRLASWGDDDLIECLLAVQPARCQSVMRRVRAAADRRRLQGRPELWRIVLDRMAADESLDDIREALRREWQARCPDQQTHRAAGTYCLAILMGPDPTSREHDVLRTPPLGPRLSKLLRHRVVQVLVGAGELAAELTPGGPFYWLTRRLPRDLVQETAALIAPHAPALQRLRELVGGPQRECHAMAASLLHSLLRAAGTGWVPQHRPPPCLRGAYLDHAAWPGVHLSEADLRRANLTAADLTEAFLDKADLRAACVRHAILRGASLRGVKAAGADFGGADLSHANLHVADFSRADLTETNLEDASLEDAVFREARVSGARFTGARLAGASFLRAEIGTADFSGADLSSANLAEADLREAALAGATLCRANLAAGNLEDIHVPLANLEEARLTSAWLTGSSLRGANLRKADLRGAALADVDWEEADLREADLRECTFHMGSSRSGLVDSPIASEGTRTGFYSDNYDQQHFRAPEEIRKANLCRADLRGANVTGVDFYLVDLRGARYTDRQAEHFRRCGAILVDPA